jgi:hypothetical protein
MKKSLILLAALALTMSARAQSQDEAPVAAAAAGDVASAPAEAAPAAAKVVSVREGKIVKLQHRCEKGAGMTGSRGEHIVQNTISQLSNKTGLTFAAQFLAGGVVGNAAGSAAQAPAENCTTEVRVRLVDDTDVALDTVVPASIGRSLRIFHKGNVRFEDGQPTFWFN